VLQVACGVSRRRRNSRTIPDYASTRIDDELDAGIDRYRVIAEIARGGTSTVYLGHHRVTGERVAIKALDAFYVGHSEMVSRLLGEHELAQRAHHPGLLEIRCAEQTGHGIPYVVMEYLDGETLGALLSRTALPVASILAMASQIASAAAALHAAGVVHCDVKPDNVFVLHEAVPGGAPRVKVIDYGVARLADELPAPGAAVVGTPAFMAPEQWHGAPTAMSDVYSFGCMLYELVTGAALFSGALPQLMTAHCERPAPRPSLRNPALAPELDRLILAALAKDAGARPTMSDIGAQLAALPSSASPVQIRDSFGELPEGYAPRLEALG
jgi:serine/threonine protein kinase